MALKSGIEWTARMLPDGTTEPGATFNTWWGCVEVSPACDNCYAKTWDARFGDSHWGAVGPRRLFGDKHWNELRKWNEQAKKSGERKFVFVASMADLFEFYPTFVSEDGRTLDTERARFFTLARECSWLCFLLLTKRPQNVTRMVPADWLTDWPDNVWMGTTVEAQRYMWRAEKISLLPAPVKFLSCEPLMEELDLRVVLSRWTLSRLEVSADWKPLFQCKVCKRKTTRPDRESECAEQCKLRWNPLGWVITGGESGENARPARSAWYRALRDQSLQFGLPFYFKQHGEWLANSQLTPTIAGAVGLDKIADRTMLWTPEDGFCSEGKGIPFYSAPESELFHWLGKKKAGNLLDGVSHKDRPSAGYPLEGK